MSEEHSAPVSVIPAAGGKRRQAVIANPTPAQMLMVAVQRGDSLENLKLLMDLRDRDDARTARMAFDEAIAEAKAEIKPIVKNRKTDFANKSGGRTSYAYEDFAAIAEHVDPILARHGLSYRYKTMQEGGQLTVICRLSHRAGHSEEVSLQSSYDNSGNKNAIQAVASAGTYLQRYTLKMALGLAASVDDDGRASGRSGGQEDGYMTITAQQVQQLDEECRRLGADKAAFLRHIRCTTFEEIAAENFQTVMDTLRAKKAMAGGKGGTTAPRSRSAAQQPQPSHADRVAELARKADQVGVAEGELLERYRVGELFHLTDEQITDALAWLGKIHAG